MVIGDRRGAAELSPDVGVRLPQVGNVSFMVRIQPEHLKQTWRKRFETFYFDTGMKVTKLKKKTGVKVSNLK